MILTIGDLMLDVLVLPGLREAEQREGIVTRGGGSAANTAAWASALRTPVTLLACAGSDAIGAALEGELREVGVQARIRTVAGMETGCVAIELSGEGERVMRSARGANEALSPEDIEKLAGLGPRIVHITGYALLNPFGVAMLEAASRIAAASGATLSFDPSSAGVIERIGRDRLLAAVTACGVEVLLPNRVEAEALTGASESLNAARVLNDAVHVVVVKEGSGGATYATAGKVVRVATVPIVPRDTTGAGDAFNAGVLVGLASGSGLDEACLLGHRVARLVLERYGGRPRRGERLEARASS